MHKLLLSHIKKLTFVLFALSDYNIDFVYHKKASELGFCSRGEKRMYWGTNRLKICIMRKGSTLKNLSTRKLLAFFNP